MLEVMATTSSVARCRIFAMTVMNLPDEEYSIRDGAMGCGFPSHMSCGSVVAASSNYHPLLRNLVLIEMPPGNR